MGNATFHMDFNNDELRILASSLNVFIHSFRFNGDCNETNFNSFRDMFDSVVTLYDKIYSCLIVDDDESE